MRARSVGFSHDSTAVGPGGASRFSTTAPARVPASVRP